MVCELASAQPTTTTIRLPAVCAPVNGTATLVCGVNGIAELLWTKVGVSVMGTRCTLVGDRLPVPQPPIARTSARLATQRILQNREIPRKIRQLGPVSTVVIHFPLEPLP